MAIKDNKSNNLLWANGITTIAAGTSFDADSLDSAHYDLGITFFLNIAVANDVADTISFVKFQDSDDNATWTDVNAEQYIGDITNLQDLTANDFTSGQAIPTIGVFGTNRYVRAVLQTGANTGDMTVVLNYNLGIEIKPGEK